MRQDQLDRLHATLLEIMDEVDRVCRENNITYYLAGGSLLGAVRHKGFIPWDDDMDIMIMRQDYEKFCSVFDFVSSGPYYLQSSDMNPNYWKSHAKVCKKNTVFKERTGIEEGIFVDIFPIDSASGKNGLFQNIRFSLIKTCDRIVCYRLFKDYNPGKAKLMCILTKPLSLGKIRKIQKNLMTYKHTGHNCYYIYESVGVYGAKRSLWPKPIFNSTVDFDFDGRKYLGPQGFDQLLKITFNNYMQLPPEDKRRTHNPQRLSFNTDCPDEILD